MTVTGAVSAPAQETNSGTSTAASPPTASIAKVGVGKRKINVRAGRRTVVAGTVLPRAAGRIAYLQIRKGKRWYTIDRDRTGARGRYRLHDKRPAWIGSDPEPTQAAGDASWAAGSNGHVGTSR